MSAASKITLALTVAVSTSIIGYVHYKQHEDREKLHEGVVRDYERQQRLQLENAVQTQDDPTTNEEALHETHGELKQPEVKAEEELKNQQEQTLTENSGPVEGLSDLEPKEEDEALQNEGSMSDGDDSMVFNILQLSNHKDNSSKVDDTSYDEFPMLTSSEQQLSCEEVTKKITNLQHSDDENENDEHTLESTEVSVTLKKKKDADTTEITEVTNQEQTPELSGNGMKI